MGKEENIKLLKNFIRRITKKYNISKILFFGSRATGNFDKESDFDLIIVSSDFKGLNFIERASKFYDYWDLNYPVDFICYTPEEFEILKKQISIVADALKFGIEIKI